MLNLMKTAFVALLSALILPCLTYAGPGEGGGGGFVDRSGRAPFLEIVKELASQIRATSAPQLIQAGAPHAWTQERVASVIEDVKLDLAINKLRSLRHGGPKLLDHNFTVNKISVLARFFLTYGLELSTVGATEDAELVHEIKSKLLIETALLWNDNQQRATDFAARLLRQIEPEPFSRPRNYRSRRAESPGSYTIFKRIQSDLVRDLSFLPRTEFLVNGAPADWPGERIASVIQNLKIDDREESLLIESNRKMKFLDFDLANKSITALKGLMLYYGRAFNRWQTLTPSLREKISQQIKQKLLHEVSHLWGFDEIKAAHFAELMNDSLSRDTLDCQRKDYSGRLLTFTALGFLGRVGRIITPFTFDSAVEETITASARAEITRDKIVVEVENVAGYAKLRITADRSPGNDDTVAAVVETWGLDGNQSEPAGLQCRLNLGTARTAMPN